MIRCVLLACLFLLTAGCVEAADRCPVDDEWAATCFELSGSIRQVKPQYRQKFAAQKDPITVITIEDPREVVAIDRRGVIVIPGIYHTGDFDYPTAEQGVGRFELAGKCGFFNTNTFGVVIPAEYDQCVAFREGEAIVCKDCKRYCTDDDCHDYKLIGGRGFAFDANGKELRKFSMPALKDACGKAGVEETTPRLKCKRNPISPFKM